MSSVVPIVTPEQLHAEQLAGKSPALIDVRTEAEYRTGHIPGAQLIAGEERSPATIENRLGRPGRGINETLYITCHAGQQAARAAENLRQSGLTNIALITIGEEKRHNLCLQVSGMQAYVDLMNGLELDHPRLMDIAVPANRACGMAQAA